MINVDSGQIDILTSYNQALALFWCVLWLKSRFDYKVVKVSDGDTVRVKRFWFKPVTVRLAEIDAPEKKQEGGEAARAALVLMCPIGSRVELQTQSSSGRWGRNVSRVFIGARDLNASMVRAGHAWHYSDYSDCAGLAESQRLAKKQKLGLWAGKNPQPPWEWRKGPKG